MVLEEGLWDEICRTTQGTSSAGADSWVKIRGLPTARRGCAGVSGGVSAGAGGCVSVDGFRSGGSVERGDQGVGRRAPARTSSSALVAGTRRLGVKRKKNTSLGEQTGIPDLRLVFRGSSRLFLVSTSPFYSQPFHSWEWSMSNFPSSPTRNITSHSMENLAFHSLLRWKMIILRQFSLPHLYIYLQEGWENVLFGLGCERVKVKQSELLLLRFSFSILSNPRTLQILISRKILHQSCMQIRAIELQSSVLDGRINDSNWPKTNRLHDYLAREETLFSRRDVFEIRTVKQESGTQENRFKKFKNKRLKKIVKLMCKPLRSSCVFFIAGRWHAAFHTFCLQITRAFFWTQHFTDKS